MPTDQKVGGSSPSERASESPGYGLGRRGLRPVLQRRLPAGNRGRERWDVADRSGGRPQALSLTLGSRRRLPLPAGHDPAKNERDGLVGNSTTYRSPAYRAGGDRRRVPAPGGMQAQLLTQRPTGAALLGWSEFGQTTLRNTAKRCETTSGILAGQTACAQVV